jgi:hypothetical protein
MSKIMISWFIMLYDINTFVKVYVCFNEKWGMAEGFGEH